jgi:membrane-associated phospholipid phosphatase
MLKQKRFLIPVIALYAAIITVMIMTAINPAFDFEVSFRLTSGGAVTYTIGNILEIWAEPVPLIPLCFIMAMAAVCAVRTKYKNKLPQILGGALMIGGAVLSYQIVERIVKYYCKLEDITAPWIVKEGTYASSLWWVKAICAAAGVLIMFLFVYLSLKIDQERLKRAQRVMIFAVVSLLLELAIVEGMKMIFGRMRFREWLQNPTNVYDFPWYKINGKPASDAFKSFPSGHTASAFLIMPVTFMFDAFGREKAGRIARIVHLCWVATVMVSRIMAGAHFLSDVCGGLFVSLTIVTVTGAILFRDGKIRKE